MVLYMGKRPPTFKAVIIVWRTKTQYYWCWCQYAKRFSKFINTFGYVKHSALRMHRWKVQFDSVKSCSVFSKLEFFVYILLFSPNFFLDSSSTGSGGIHIWQCTCMKLSPDDSIQAMTLRNSPVTDRTAHTISTAISVIRRHFFMPVLISLPMYFL